EGLFASDPPPAMGIHSKSPRGRHSMGTRAYKRGTICGSSKSYIVWVRKAACIRSGGPRMERIRLTLPRFGCRFNSDRPLHFGRVRPRWSGTTETALREDD